MLLQVKDSFSSMFAQYKTLCFFYFCYFFLFLKATLGLNCYQWCSLFNFWLYYFDQVRSILHTRLPFRSGVHLLLIKKTMWCAVKLFSGIEGHTGCHLKTWYSLFFLLSWTIQVYGTEVQSFCPLKQYFKTFLFHRC